MLVLGKEKMVVEDLCKRSKQDTNFLLDTFSSILDYTH